jgi:hypothetical protein
MKKLLLLLLCVPLIGLGQDNKGECISGDCENGYGTWIRQAAKYSFTGEFKNGKPHYGTAISHGDTYVGEYVNGLRQGKGTETFANGDKYVGEYKNGMIYGQGTVTYANGNKYVGEYVNGYKNGKGKLTYANGTVKEGLWENGRFIGKE